MENSELNRRVRELEGQLDFVIKQRDEFLNEVERQDARIKELEEERDHYARKTKEKLR
jgi:cell division septum initiation protein DivIVA